MQPARLLLRAPAMLPFLFCAVLAAPRPGAPARIEAPAAEAPAPDPSRLLARLAAADPPVEEVQAAAARRAAASAEAGESWASRSRAAPWLPRLSTWYRHDERSWRTVGTTSSAEVDYLKLAPTDEIGVRLTWDLPALVFSEAELRASEAAARAAHRRLEAAERATRLYYRRRQLLARLLLAPPPDPAERAAAEVAIEEATAELDAITGGLLRGRR